MFRPNREFQSGLNREQTRRERESQSLSLRRKNREKTFQNKRQKILNQSKSSQSSSTASISNKNKLPHFVEGLYSKNKAIILQCTRDIRKLLSVPHNAPIKQVIDTNIIPQIISFLVCNGCDDLKFEAMWILTNIASSDKPQYTAKIIRDGSIGIFIDLLNSPSYELKEQTAWCLGNISGDCTKLKNMILRQNILPYLLKICQTNYNYKYCDDKQQVLSLLDTVSWLISNLCRGGINNKQDLNGILQCLWCLIKQYNQLKSGHINDNIEIGMNIAWSFHYLTSNIDWYETDNYFMNIMNNNGILSELIGLLDVNGQYKLKRTVIFAIGNILNGDDIYTQNCIDNGILKYFYQFLCEYYSKSPQFDTELKDICWCISNITAGDKQQCLAVAKYNILPILIRILQDSGYSVGSQAMWALANTTNMIDATNNDDNDKMMNYLIQNGLIKAVCMFFRSHFGNNQYNKSRDKTLIAALELTENILVMDTGNNNDRVKIEFEQNGGVNFLEYIQSDENVSRDLYDKAAHIVKRYFNEEIENEIYNGYDDIDIGAYHDIQYENQFGFGLKQNTRHNIFEF